MKILVTGLCLSQNLGGPAMALTLVDQLTLRMPGAEFLFAVDAISYPLERKWATHYGLEIVEGDNVVSFLLNTHPILKWSRKVYRRMRKPSVPKALLDYEGIHERFMQAYRESDVIVSMRGVSYVGDGMKGFFEGPLSYSDLHYAKKHNKPFAHFVQSFGPFDDWKVRYFARRDFEYVDFIPARGRESAQHCRKIVADPQKVYDFPDIAILLPAADEKWTSAYLQRLGLLERGYLVLSPSSVIHQLPSCPHGGTGEDHVRSFYLIARKQLTRGETLLFLPHMYSDDKRQCDREVCRKVIRLLDEGGTDCSRCRIVEDDLDVWQAKGLISKSKGGVFSRYHAIVAAVSTATPVVAIGWNIKYQDIMDYYGISSMAIDSRDRSPEEIAAFGVEKIEAYRHQDFTPLLREKQKENVERVELAFNLLADWIRRHT